MLYTGTTSDAYARDMGQAIGPLQDRRILVVEDEYMIADDLSRALEAAGAEVIGPAASVPHALRLLAKDEALDAAVLDVSLRDLPVYPVAEELDRRAIPLLFATGFDAAVIPDTYRDRPRCEKPFVTRMLVDEVTRLF